MADVIRIGEVSSVNYKTGMVSVVYKDQDNAVTDMLPCLSLDDEYKMPAVGDDVVCLHFPNGMAAGICLGKYWNEDNRSALTGKDVFRKELARQAGKAYIQYKNGTITIKADRIVLDGPVTATGDVKGSGVSLASHTHSCSHGDTGGPS